VSLPITTRSRSIPEEEFSPARLFLGTAMVGSAAAIAASLITTISPLGGAIFGASSFLGNRLVHWICDRVSCCPESLIFRIARFALSLIGGIVSGSFTAAAFGFPMTAGTAVIMTATSAAVTISALLILGNCLCSSVILSGIAVAPSYSSLASPLARLISNNLRNSDIAAPK